MERTSLPERLKADPAGISRAAELLRQGRLVAVPTETVYGLAARADRDESVAAIYRAKGRPSFNPLIVHVPDMDAARKIARFDDRALQLAQAFWPGALTMVLPLQEAAKIAPAVTAGLPTVALRCPAHNLMQEVLARTGVPLAAPSANRSGAVSPTDAAHVLASLGENVDAVLDGGTCEQGLESTIVALRNGGAWQILRPGPITEAQVLHVLGVKPTAVASQAIEAPGQLARHYAPGKPVRLDAIDAMPDEFHIGFGAITGNETLSSTGDLMEAASRLYGLLHRAAVAQQPHIAVAPIPSHGVGAAINDRLRRAAS